MKSGYSFQFDNDDCTACAFQYLHFRTLKKWYTVLANTTFISYKVKNSNMLHLAVMY